MFYSPIMKPFVDVNPPFSSDPPADPELYATLLDDFIEKSPVGFAFLDRDLIYRRINTTLAQMNGLPASEHIGKTVPEVCPTLSDAQIAHLRGVINNRQPLEGLEIQADTHTYLTSYYPVTAPGASELLGMGAFVVDITEQRRAEKQLEETRLQQRVFLRDILFNVSEGKLRLCDSPDDFPAPLPQAGDPIELTLPSLRQLRKHMTRVAEETGLPEDRWQDLETAVGEAAMNAVIHGGGGIARVHARKPDGEGGLIQVWIEDTGEGIAVDRLHRATLERGFTTAGSMGHGWPMVLKTGDRVYLLTGSSGTTVVIEQEEIAPQPAWLQDL